jgi:hypothetical protein
MTRWKASAIHLLISVCVGLCAAALIFGVWYPPPYSHAVGADQLVLLLLGVDAVLGPLLTLVVFKSGKKSLRFDLSVIALLQVCAFFYGMSVVVRARPAFIVGRADRFVIVSANDLDDDDFAKAARPEFRSAPWAGPKVIGAQAPTDIQQHNELMFSSAGGKDLERFPQYYTDYDAVAPTLLSHAKPLEELEKKKPESADLVADVLALRKMQADDVVWVPLDARRASMTMLLERSSGQPLQAIAIDPW